MSYIEDVVSRVEKRWEFSRIDALKEVKTALSEMVADTIRKYIKGAELNERLPSDLFRDMKELNVLIAQLKEVETVAVPPPVPSKKAFFSK